MTSFATTCATDMQVDECNDDLDSIAGILTELRLAPPSSPAAPPKISPAGGIDWPELFAGEMRSATDMANAKARTSTLLTAFQISVDQKRLALEARVRALEAENALLKQSRQKELEDRNRTESELRQELAAYKEHVGMLELDNSSLREELNMDLEYDEYADFGHVRLVCEY